MYLSIEYDGDVGNALIDGRLVADDFCNGQPWIIALDRFRPEVLESGICLHIAPRREGVMVTKESGMAGQRELQGNEVAAIRSITAIPEYDVTIRQS